MKIPLSEPLISGNEWKYIKDCLDTGWVSSVGAYVNRFEEMVANYVGTQYAIATVNGTSALHVSLLACGVQPDDEVIVPTLTFIAPVNTVRYCGAYPVFMDCTLNSFCMDVQKVKEFISKECEQRRDGYTYNKRSGRRVKAVIPVHILGHPVEMDELVKICHQYNIDIIEDATESLGSQYRGKKTGAFGKIASLSFNGNKIITTGGGGMVLTNREELASRVRHLTTQAKRDPFEYDHDEIGYNYRLTNVQAALGVAQMERLPEFINIKRKNAEIYRRLLSDLKEVEIVWEAEGVISNFWIYAIRVSRKDKRPLMDFLMAKGIQVRPLWKLIHTLPMYKDCQADNIGNAIDAYETCISLPSSVSIREEEINFVVSSIREFYSV